MTYADRAYATDAENIRAARKEANGGSHTEAEWRDQLHRQRYRCYNPFCKCDLRADGVVAHRDHNVPIARGGTDNIDNIKAMCGPCNQRKHARGWNEFLVEEGRRALHQGDIYGREGQHANDIGRAAYGGTGGGHFGSGGGGSFTGATQGGPGGSPNPSGPNSVGDGGAWAALQFVIGVVKGGFVLLSGALFAVLLLMAIVGNGSRRNNGSRLADGAVGAFGLWRLSTWAFRNNSRAKSAGMVVGALAAGLWLMSLSGAPTHESVSSTPVHVTETAPEDTGKYRVTESGPAPQGLGVRPVDLNNGPTAVRPLTMTPRYTPPAWTPPVVASTPRGRMGPTPAPYTTAPASADSPFALRQVPGRRNIGCGWWPVGSDADRDCAAASAGRSQHRNPVAQAPVVSDKWKAEIDISDRLRAANKGL
jgi:HNH endonuclease